MGGCCCSLGGSPAGRVHHNGNYCKVQLRFVAWLMRNKTVRAGPKKDLLWSSQALESVYDGGRISINQGHEVDASTMTLKKKLNLHKRIILN